MPAKNNRTTMAKLNRESKLRERRALKQARKDARKHAAATGAADIADAEQTEPVVQEEEPPKPAV